MNTYPVSLPSGGTLYDGKVPEGKINYHPMSGKEQGILYSMGGDPTVKLNNIISGCLVDCPVPPLDLLITDRMYIMLVLRTRSFGGDYIVPMQCSNCRVQFKHNLNLATDLEIKHLAKDEKEPLSFTLPISGDTLEYRFLRGHDENLIARNSKRILMTSTDPSDPSFAMRLAIMILKINGEEKEDQREKEHYVSGLDAGDTEAFSEDVEIRESGLDMNVFVDCRACGFTNETTLPFTSFKPSDT